MTDRIGNWMQTYTGKAFYPLDPRPEDIDVRDIAHALSNICRYGGHVQQFYSVAEHCVLMSRALRREGHSREVQLAALLHDATEAYVGDMIRPLKRMLPAYSEAEGKVAAALEEWSGINLVITDPAVHDADMRICVNEKNELMWPAPQPWDTDDLDPLPVTVYCWMPLKAERKYLDRFQELTAAASPRSSGPAGEREL